METFSKHCRFILTCNYVEKVIDPIQSRCQTFSIIPPTKKDVAVQISKILTSEEIKFEPKALFQLLMHPILIFVRLSILANELNQRWVESGCSKFIRNDYKQKVIDILKSSDDKRNKYMKIRQVIADIRQLILLNSTLLCTKK